MTPQKKQNKLENKINFSKTTLDLHCLPAIRKIGKDDFTDEMKICKWRSETDYHIFKVYEYTFKQIQDGFIMLQLRCQLPAQLLASITISTLQNALYMIKSIAFSMQKLITMFGCFRVTEKMIGLSKQNICKIWVNQKLEENFVIQNEESETCMINNVIKIIGNKLNDQNIKKQLMKALLYKCSNFYQLSQLIWKFSYNQQIIIPPTFIFTEKKINKRCKVVPDSRRVSEMPPLSAEKSRFIQNNGRGTSRFYDRSSKVQLVEKTRQILADHDCNTSRQKYEKSKIQDQSQKNIRVNQVKVIKKKNRRSYLVNKKSSEKKDLTRSDNAFSQPSKQNHKRKHALNFLQQSTNVSQNQNVKSIVFSDNDSSNKDYNLNDCVKNNKNASEEKNNVIVMKKMIKDRLNICNSIKVTQLNACGTVKSIGDFMESQRDLEAEQKQILILKSMGRQVNMSLLEESLQS